VALKRYIEPSEMPRNADVTVAWNLLPLGRKINQPGRRFIFRSGRTVDIGASFPTDAETAKLMQPTVGPLHNTAVYAKSTVVFRISWVDCEIL
jgi:hypothetical protein